MIQKEKTLMGKFLEKLKSKKFKTVMRVLDIVIMLVLLYLYLLYADLSTAPDFIYNQF